MTVSDKWTDIEHLPEWDEEYYDVYTAKKFGKWVMLKTLKPQYKQSEDMCAMIEKEFDVRYNLCHPNIIMVNDFEDVPTLGRCIITDDVYGDSLRKLIRDGKVTDRHIAKMRYELVDALEYIQANHLAHHPLSAENIIFTENIGNLKLIDVGFEQRKALTPTDTASDIYNFGLVMQEAMSSAAIEDAALRRVVDRCLDPDPSRRFRDVQHLKLALANRRSDRIYVTIIAFLSAMVILLIWLALNNR